MASLTVAALVAATGNLVHAEPEPRARGHVGVDAVGGAGLLLLFGGTLRVELPVSESRTLTARAGALQLRRIDSESNELYPAYLGHLGVRFYGAWWYGAVEGGVLTDRDYRGRQLRPSAALVLGLKPTTRPLDVGISIMASGLGVSLCAHFGIDIVTW